MVELATCILNRDNINVNIHGYQNLNEYLKFYHAAQYSTGAYPRLYITEMVLMPSKQTLLCAL